MPDDTKTTREVLATAIEQAGLDAGVGFAAFIRHGDPDTPVPCWGGIARRFEDAFRTDAERIALLDVLVEVGDRRPLLLFIDANRGRPAVLREIVERAPSMDVGVQRAILACEGAGGGVPEVVEQLAPSARQLWQAGEDARRREWEGVRARVGKLRAREWFVGAE